MERKALARAGSEALPASAASQTYSPASEVVGLPMVRRRPKLWCPWATVTPFLFQLTLSASRGLGERGCQGWGLGSGKTAQQVLPGTAGLNMDARNGPDGSAPSGRTSMGHLLGLPGEDSWPQQQLAVGAQVPLAREEKA